MGMSMKIKNKLQSPLNLIKANSYGKTVNFLMKEKYEVDVSNGIRYRFDINDPLFTISSANTSTQESAKC